MISEGGGGGRGDMCLALLGERREVDVIFTDRSYRSGNSCMVECR